MVVGKVRDGIFAQSPLAAVGRERSTNVSLISPTADGTLWVPAEAATGIEASTEAKAATHAIRRVRSSAVDLAPPVTVMCSPASDEAARCYRRAHPSER